MASTARAPTRVLERGPQDCDGSLAGRRGRRPPSRQIYRCCRRVRTTATGKTSAPSVGLSRTLRPRRALPCLLFTRTASPRTLSLAANLGQPRQRQPGHLKLSRASAKRFSAIRVCGEKDASHRLLQPTLVTSTLRTAVFPALPSRRSPPCGGSRPERRRLTLGHSRAARDPGETSLPAFPVSQPDGSLA